MGKEKSGYVIETEEQSGCRLAAKIDIAKEEVQKAYKKAIKKINKEISLPGFRKGKAPDEAVIQKYPSHLEQEWKEIVVNDAFQAVLDQTKIYPFNKQSIEKPKIEKCSLEEGGCVRIVYEHYPQLPKIDFSSLKLPNVEKEGIDEKQIEQILKEIQEGHSDWETLEVERPKMGDYVEVSIDKIDEETPREMVKNRLFRLTEEMVPWLKKLIVDLKVGESVEGMSDPKEEGAYTPAKVRVQLHAVKKMLLPPVDDALAQKVGAPNKEALLQKIRSNLEEAAVEKQKEATLRALEQALVDRYNFELPSTLVASEEQRALEEQKRRLSAEEFSKKEKEILKEVKKQVEESLRLYFLLEEIREEGKITLSQDELSEKINEEMLRNPYYMQISKTNKDLFAKLIRQLSTKFLQDKIKEYALEKTLTAH